MAEDTFRILVSTDNHLGFAEKDGVRGRDTYNTFEEILRLAQHYEVDFILFGGDIFHENRPSISCIHEALRLLRTYCFGSRPIRFEMYGESAKVFSNTGFPVNHLDSNLNVAIPSFTIHGNHDDSTGPSGLSAIDILHDAGVVNLFGKTSSVERIDVNPLLIRKGSTHLAIYGLSAVREERLHRLFLNKKVTFYRPKEQPDQWFSLCVVHQNRVRHGPTNYLPEEFLPNFLDLVVWGHEHECRLRAEWNSTQNFFVIQPGSSVATALSEGEAQNKAVALLEVHGKEFKVTKIPLRTVRPFRIRDIVLQDETPSLDPATFDASQQVETTCARYVETLISELDAISKDSTSGDEEDSSHQKCVLNPPTTLYKGLYIPPEPLIRVRVDLSGGFESFSTFRFAQRFVGRIANPKDIVSFNHNRDRLTTAQNNRLANRDNPSGINSQPPLGSVPDGDGVNPVGPDVVQLEELVRRYLKECYESNNKLSADTMDNRSAIMQVFTTVELGHCLQQFVNQDSKDAITSVVDSVLGKTMNHLRQKKSTEDAIVSAVTSFCASRHASDNVDKDSGMDVTEPSTASTSQPMGKLRKKNAVNKKVINDVWSSGGESDATNEDTIQTSSPEALSDNDELNKPKSKGKLPQPDEGRRSPAASRAKRSAAGAVSCKSKRLHLAQSPGFEREEEEDDDDFDIQDDDDDDDDNRSSVIQPRGRGQGRRAATARPSSRSHVRSRLR